jgi:uncharacterized protein
MPRPRRFRKVGTKPKSMFFKPQGIPVRNLEHVHLSMDEIEAIKLKNIEGIDMTEGAKKMKISKSTFQRIIKEANRKIADGIINGKAIKIINLNTMPNFDGTGPKGEGPVTGRKLGPCAKEKPKDQKEYGRRMGLQRRARRNK